LLSKKLAATDDSFVTNALTKANQQVNRMTDLIHGFLDLSKQEPAKLKVKIQEFDMVKLVEESIADALLVSPQRMIEFESTGPITVAADRQKIGQVIGNFLSNAVKYSDKEGKISVSCKALGAEVEVAVKDEGIGIRLKDQAKLFQRFYRVESAKMKNISGFGIGLYLASEIIQRHKGTIGVESKETVGSRFYFTLPRG
jgi:two-component system sensor histidine kinase VicK